MYKKFASYYKPHLKEFSFDLLCALLVAVCNIAYPFIAESIIDVHVKESVGAVLLWGGVVMAIFIVKAVLTYIIDYFGHFVGLKIQREMRKELFSHLQKLPCSYYDKTKTGSIMSRIVNDLFEVAELAHHGPEDLLISVVSFIGAVVMLFLLNPVLALIVALFFPIFAVITIYTRKKMTKAFAVAREKTAEVNAQVQNSVAGIRVSKAYTAEAHEAECFDKRSGEYQKARKGVLKHMSRYHAAMHFCTDAMYLICIVSGALMFFFGYVTDSVVLAYILYVTMLIEPFRIITSMVQQVEDGMAGFKRFREVMEVEPEKEPTHPVSIEQLQGDICYDNISFSYTRSNDEKNVVVQNFSLEIEKGKVVALVGPSGSGKTTICNLLPRFYDISEGKILIDGIDIRDISIETLRKNIGIVAQDSLMFNGTIKDNLLYGNFDATDEEIAKAAKLADLDGFISTLKEGYNTVIGEYGVMLSGGQRQRLSIARAFLKDPPILILDEATSSLDSFTEIQIQKALTRLEKGRTTIIVAHRLSTVKNADEIIVITDKGVAERGNHSQLLKQNGIYAKLYGYQIQLFDEAS